MIKVEQSLILSSYQSEFVSLKTHILYSQITKLASLISNLTLPHFTHKVEIRVIIGKINFAVSQGVIIALFCVWEVHE